MVLVKKNNPLLNKYHNKISSKFLTVTYKLLFKPWFSLPWELPKHGRLSNVWFQILTASSLVLKTYVKAALSNLFVVIGKKQELCGSQKSHLKNNFGLFSPITKPRPSFLAALCAGGLFWISALNTSSTIYHLRALRISSSVCGGVRPAPVSAYDNDILMRSSPDIRGLSLFYFSMYIITSLNKINLHNLSETRKKDILFP